MTPQISIVAPARNEEANVGPLVEEVERALGPGTLPWEILIVDDGSTDDTTVRLRDLQSDHPRLRSLRLIDLPAGRGLGQSAAFHAGFRAALGRIIVVMDADLQNDPADIPRLLTLLDERRADMVQGDRTRMRRDGRIRRMSSAVGRAARRALLGDTTRDTGCSLRVMRREVALALPLQYRGMHRFIPYTARQLGYVVIEEPVTHRPRVAGRPKYGVWNRAFPGLIDCLAVRWMTSRRRAIRFEETPRAGERGAA